MSVQIRRSRVSLRVACCCCLLLSALTYACGGGSDSSTNPLSGGHGVRVVAGGGQSDTVHAVLGQALVVEIHDSTGGRARGALVDFSPVVGPSGSPGVLVAPPGQQQFSISAGAITDAQGQAK